VKRSVAAGAFALALVALLAARAEEPTHGRVLLISIDGLRPEAYLEERFGMKNLRALGARGVTATRVTGVFPTLTYPSHTSIVTGVRPARHGIASNTRFDPREAGRRWYFETANMRAEPIWDTAHRAGLKTAAVRWPVSVGATIDWNIPEVFGLELADDHWSFVKKYATPGLLADAWPEDPKNSLDEPAMDVQATGATVAILSKKKPDLLLLHLVEADGAQHHAGRDAEEVRRAFETIDGLLGKIFEALETAGLAASTNVIVTGDHGFMDLHTGVRANALLREAGFLTIDSRGKLADWTAVAHPGGGSTPIYLRDPSDGAVAARVLATLESAAASRYRGIFNVLDRAALDREEAFPGALCALEAEPGFGFDPDPSGPVLVAVRSRGLHGHLPSRPELATGLVAAGPGLAAGRVLPIFRQIDVEPLVAHLLGVEPPPGVEGVLVAGALRAE
jgi:hypothetical protein